MKQKIYIETSVVSYLTARLSKDIVIAGHQASTYDFWVLLDSYDVYISELVIQEAECGDESLAKAISENLLKIRDILVRRYVLLTNFQENQMTDPIVEEVRKFRNEHAKKFNYDLDAICEDLILHQKTSKYTVVNLNKNQKANQANCSRKNITS